MYDINDINALDHNDYIPTIDFDNLNCNMVGNNSTIEEALYYKILNDLYEHRSFTLTF